MCSLPGMSNMLSKNVLSGLHHYKAVLLTVPTQQRMERLPVEAFKPQLQQESLKFGQIQSVKQTPEHYSPGAGNISFNTADITMCRTAYLKQNWDLIKNGWQGGIFKASRQLIFEDNQAKGYYYIGLLHMKDSCLLVWPCNLKKVPIAEVTLAEPHLGLKQPMLYPACSIIGLNCWCYDWMSYYGLWEKYPLGRNHFKPGNLFCILQLFLHPHTVWLRGSVWVDVVNVSE